jgi:hypothetical protein
MAAALDEPTPDAPRPPADLARFANLPPGLAALAAGITIPGPGRRR